MKISKADEMKETRELGRCLDLFVKNYHQVFRGTEWEELTEKAGARRSGDFVNEIFGYFEE